MIYPELRRIRSPELTPPALPPDPDDCAVLFQVAIGARGGSESDAFAFTVVTADWLARSGGARWGHGLLFVPRFDWDTVKHALARLLAQCARPSWDEVTAALRRELDWQPESAS
jgi:hypothetical protein